MPPSNTTPNPDYIDFVDLLDADFTIKDTPRPRRPWPPPWLKIYRFGHPVTSWSGRLLEYMRKEPDEVLHFPEEPVVQQVAHEGEPIPFVLIGLRMFTQTKPFYDPAPHVGDGATWGAVVELDGKDMLSEPLRWYRETDGFPSRMSSYVKTTHWTIVTVTGAISATQGMRLARYVVGQDGQRVRGSDEAWVIDDGQVRPVNRDE